MPLMGSPSPLLISAPSSPAPSSGSPHLHHALHRPPLNPLRGAGSSSNSYGHHALPSGSSSQAFGPTSITVASAFTSLASSAAGPSTATTSGKRSRDEDDDDDADMSAVREDSSSPTLHSRNASWAQQRSASTSTAQQLTFAAPPNGRPMVHKKLRSFIDSQATQNGEPGGSGAPPPSSIDLGKMLASLDRPELLSLILRLLSTSTDASLPAQVQALLPTPSLESISATLNNLEAAIQQAMPLAGARPEYVWGRIRTPLNDFATTAVALTETLLQRRNPQAGSASSSSSFAAGASQSTTELDPDGHVHPTTAFAFLLDLTARVLRIEHALPSPPKSLLYDTTSMTSSSSSSNGGSGTANGRSPSKSNAATASQTSSWLVFKQALHDKEAARTSQERAQAASSSLFGTLNRGEPSSTSSSADALVKILLPNLLAQWDTLLRRLSSAVNQQGRMFGQEVVLGWYRALIALGSSGAASASSDGRSTAFGASSFGLHASRPSFGFGSSTTAAPSSGFGFGFGSSAPIQSSSFGFGTPSSGTPASSVTNDAKILRPEEEAIRAAMDWVKDVFEREIGWLVGLDKMRAMVV